MTPLRSWCRRCAGGLERPGGIVPPTHRARQPVPDARESGRLGGAGLWPARREQWREMRADIAGIEDRDAERRGRRTTRGHASRSKWVTLAALFSRMARRYSHASVVAPQQHALRAMRYAVA